jgi:hypothetical protein
MEHNLNHFTRMEREEDSVTIVKQMPKVRTVLLRSRSRIIWIEPEPQCLFHIYAEIKFYNVYSWSKPKALEKFTIFLGGASQQPFTCILNAHKYAEMLDYS